MTGTSGSHRCAPASRVNPLPAGLDRNAGGEWRSMSIERILIVVVLVLLVLFLATRVL